MTTPRSRHARAVLALVGVLFWTLALAWALAAAPDATAPRVSMKQTVAAVEAALEPLGGRFSDAPTWAQRVGDLLVARVRVRRGLGYRHAWVAYSLSDRQLLWMTTQPEPASELCPYLQQALHGTAVFWTYATRGKLRYVEAQLYLLDLQTGQAHVIPGEAVQRVVTETNAAGGLLAAPAVDASTDYLVLGSPTHARAILPETGQLVWETTLPWPPSYATYRPYPAWPYVFFYCSAGRVVAVDGEDGTTVWHRDLLHVDPKPHAMPVGTDTMVWEHAVLLQVDSLRVFVHLGHAVYALARWNGMPLWKTQLSRDQRSLTFCQPVVWQGLLVLVMSDPWSGPAQIMALDVDTGEVVWTYALGQIAKHFMVLDPRASDSEWIWNEVSSNLLIAGDKLLFCTADGMLRALGNDGMGEHWQLRLSPQSQRLDFAATLFDVGSHVVAFNGAKVWWIELPSTDTARSGEADPGDAREKALCR